MQKVSRITEELIRIDSPTGYTDEVVSWLEERFSKSGITTVRTHKGALIAGNHPEPELLIAGHIDTLGAMVSSISTNGIIRITQLGGWPITSFEGEYLTLLTQNGQRYRGCFLLDNPASHVNRRIDATQRNAENTHVRLDVIAEKRKDLDALGIQVGDFIFFDTRFEYVNTGYLRSRFLDNKAGSACMIEVAEELAAKLKDLPVCFYFSNYEEVGHGASGGFPASVQDMLVIDMGVVGDGPEGSERHLSICAKDSSGPYDFNFRQEIVSLAQKENLPYRIDVYPFYGSDGSAALRAGGQYRVALVGPGVAASHGVERTHEEALSATSTLIRQLILKRYGSQK